MNRVGENVVSMEEYNAASVDSENFTATGLTLVGTMHYSFNSDGKLFRKKYVAADGSEQKYVFEFRDEQNVAVQLPTGAVSHAKTDHLGRKVFDEIQLGTGLMHRTFTYHEGKITDAHKENGKQVSEPTTTLVKEIQFHDGRTIAYEYDAEERITKVTDSLGGVTVYTYDSLGQLLTETVDGKVINTMTYDGYGNIKTKNGVTYTYGNAKWKDLLTAYNGKAITYDANGNPTSYQGTAATWEKGRQLKTFGANSYKYNNEDIRIQKRTATEIHDYILDGSNIVKEIVSTTAHVQKYVNEYLYDLDGTVCGIKYNDTAYYFYKNQRGDVIAITDTDGAVVAQYTYDAWGVPTVKSDTSGCGIATVNPFRYRGYYYDAETKFYYLQSRYYNPETGRFINADSVNMVLTQYSTNTINLFVYCNNDPVSNNDQNGKIAVFVTMAIGALFGVVVQWVIDMVTNLIQGKKNIVKPCSTRWDYICSALSGALAATGIGKMASMFASAIISTINYVLNCVTNRAQICRLELFITFVVGLICGFIGGSGANLKEVNGVVKQSKTILKTAVSPKKIAMYSAKIKSAIVSTIVSAIRYIVSAVANAVGGAGKRYIRELVGC